MDGPLKKVRYKEFKDYEELVRETDKYDNRLQAEKEEGSKREFVNAVISTVSPSDSQLLWAAIDNIRNKQVKQTREGKKHLSLNLPYFIYFFLFFSPIA